MTIWIHNTGNNSEKNEKSYKWQYKIVAYGDYNSSEKDYFINQASEDDDISEVQEGHEEQDKNEVGIGPLKSDTGEVVREEKDMAELLNRFFSSVFTREDSNNIPEPKEKVEKAGLSQVKITRAKVKSKIKKLRAGAAAGPDGIGPQLLKALVEQVARNP